MDDRATPAAPAVPAAIDRLAGAEAIDRAAGPLGRLADAAVGGPDRARLRAALEGDWLGHPLHPVLTDLPIGFWTAANVLDLGGRRTRGAADAMVLLGVASAVPTVAAGLADWRHLGTADRRIGTVHAAANAVATWCYATSLVHRMRGRRAAGVLTALAGAAAATAGGMLGGHLAFGRGDDPAATAAGERSGIVDQTGAAIGAIADRDPDARSLAG